MNNRVNSHFVGASLTEFLSVWSLGGEASISLTTKGGNTDMSFNISLGNPGAPFPFSHPSPASTPPPQKPRYRGPAEKDRGRQRAARYQAAKTSALPTSPISNPAAGVPASSPTNVADPVTSSPTASIPTTDSVESPSVILPTFNCDICDFTTATERGVKTHKGHKHKEHLCNIVTDKLHITPEKIRQSGNENHCSLIMSPINDVREEPLNISVVMPTDDEETKATELKDTQTNEVLVFEKWNELGTGFQNYFDALEKVNDSELDSKEKEKAHIDIQMKRICCWYTRGMNLKGCNL